MKQYITKFLKSLALCFMGFPVLYIMAVATLFDIALAACGKILLSPSYWIVSAVAVIGGYGLWELRRWAWYVFLVSQGLIFLQTTAIVFDFAESHHRLFALILSVFLQVVITKRVANEIYVPYLFPQIRWWESNPRYKLSAAIHLERKSGERADGEILDISSTGCFIKIRQELRQNENLMLNSNILGESLQCHGVVVWLAESAVIHPKGIGVKFIDLNKPQKKTLKAIAKKLKRIASVYRRYRYLLNQEEFLKQLEKVGG